MWNFLGAALIALIAAGGSWLVARRTTSGGVATSTAQNLWDTQNAELKAAREEIRLMRVEAAAGRAESVAMREETLAMRETMIQMRSDAAEVQKLLRECLEQHPLPPPPRPRARKKPA